MTTTFWMAAQAFVALALLYAFLTLVFRAYYSAKLAYVSGLVDCFYELQSVKRNLEEKPHGA